MTSCERCGVAIVGSGVSYGRFCSQRCYRTAWMKARRTADPQAYREETRQRRQDPEFMARQREANRRHAERNRERIADRQREWARRNPEKVRAESMARKAVKAGRLQRESCLFCDDPNTHAHHHDYSQPLNVTWLCAKHHGLVHRKDPANV